jgi:hypothetical protein
MNNLLTSHIGDDTLLQSHVKMTATCWTRCVYRYPPLANQIWQSWRTLGQNEANISNIPVNIPKDWKNIPMICNNIIRPCPFCKQHLVIQQKIGNLEHLHMYCSSPSLQEVRLHCNQNIENAIRNLYEWSSMIEYNCSFQDRPRNTILQENMNAAAKATELEIRPIVQAAHLKYERREYNQAIQSQHDIQLAVLLHKLPIEKLTEFDNFPLMSQLGFLHAIPEDQFDISSATIIDVSILGLFPKKIFPVLQNYERSCNSTYQATFQSLINELITAFIYRPITIQKVIHILTTQKKKTELDLASRERDTLDDNTSHQSIPVMERSNA